MDTQELLRTYSQYLQHEKALSPKTTGIYLYELERAFLFLGQGRPLSSLTSYDLKDYLAHLRENRRCKPATIGRVTSTLKGFFRFLHQRGYLETNPAIGLKSPKLPRKLPVFLLRDESKAVVEGAQHRDPHIALRNKTIIGLSLMTGMRVSEVVGLDLNSVQLNDGFMRVLGKGRKERLIPLNNTSAQLIKDWLPHRLSEQSDCKALFLSRSGGRMTPRMVLYLVKQAARIAALDRRLSPHKLRHTFATSLYGQTVNLREIQELLGHTSLSSTSIYTHTNVDRVRAAVNRLKL